MISVVAMATAFVQCPGLLDAPEGDLFFFFSLSLSLSCSLPACLIRLRPLMVLLPSPEAQNNHPVNPFNPNLNNSLKLENALAYFR